MYKKSVLNSALSTRLFAVSIFKLKLKFSTENHAKDVIAAPYTTLHQFKSVAFTTSTSTTLDLVPPYVVLLRC